MEKKAFYTIEELCNGCANCSLVCSLVLSGDSFGKESNVIVVHAEEAGYNQPGLTGAGYDTAVAGCNAEPCGYDPKCVRYCPTGALIYGDISEISEKKRLVLELRKSKGEARIRAPWAQRR